MRSSPVLVFILCTSCLLVPGPATETADAAGDIANANLEMLADPSRPIVYACDTSGSEISFYNASTGELISSIFVGSHPLALDLSNDGGLLYSAVTQESKIAVIDIEARKAIGNISLGFQPLSVRDGRYDRLYVSGFIDGLVRVIELSSGTVLHVINVGFDTAGIDLSYSFSVEMSPDGNTLLATILGTRPIRMAKYDTSADVAVYLESVNSPSGYMVQQLVDWDNDIVYTVSADTNFVERTLISTLEQLSDLTVTDTGVSAITSSPEEGMAYVMTVAWGTVWPTRIVTALDLSDGSRRWSANLSMVTMPDYADSMNLAVAPSDNRSIFVGFPVARLSFEPWLAPRYPVPGEVFFDVPEYFEAALWCGLPARDLISVGILVDGMPTFTDPIIYDYDRARITAYPDFPLLEGTHTVAAYFQWADGNTTAEWTFWVDTSWMFPPVLQWSYPMANEVLHERPGHLEAEIVDPGAPDIEFLGLFASVNGAELEAYLYEESVVRANLTADDLDVLNMALVGLEWTDGYRTFESIVTWSFVVLEIGDLIPEEHSSGFSIPVPSSWDVLKDQTINDNLFEFKIVGPTLANITTNVLVDTGTNTGVSESNEYLRSTLEKVVVDLRAAGVDVEIVGQMEYVTISGHGAALMTIEWPEYQLSQRIGIITSDEHDRFWVITCTASTAYFESIEPIFVAMILGLEITLDESFFGEEEIVQMAIWGAIAYGVFAAVAITIAVVYKLTRKN